MADLVLRGGRPLSGTVVASGNKNAVMPMLCATLLSDEPVVIDNVPDITDVRRLVAYMRELGSEIDWDTASHRMRLCHAKIGKLSEAAPLPDGMRSSLLLLPALLWRAGKVRLASDTQGCSLGIREIDPHLEVLTALGAKL